MPLYHIAGHKKLLYCPAGIDAATTQFKPCPLWSLANEPSTLAIAIVGAPVNMFPTDKRSLVTLLHRSDFRK